MGIRDCLRHNRICKAIVRNLLPPRLVLQRLSLRAGKSVLLTFDDGPDPKTTPVVLERLAWHGAKAVFFVVGKQVLQHPNIVKLIVKEGHLVGNHTATHAYSQTTPFQPYLIDIVRGNEIIRETIEKKTTLFRPPGGWVTLKSLVTPLLFEMRFVRWSLASGDVFCQSSEEAIEVAKILADKIQPRDIVLLHDNCPYIGTILDVLLPLLKKRGFNLGTAINYLPGVPFHLD